MAQGTAQSTYYDRKHRQGQALIRARRPYLVKNAVTGIGLFALVGGICTRIPRYPEDPSASVDYDILTVILDAMTLSKVGQDDFDDVKVPDTPRAPAAPK